MGGDGLGSGFKYPELVRRDRINAGKDEVGMKIHNQLTIIQKICFLKLTIAFTKQTNS